MLEKIKKYIHDLLTARNGEDYSMTKLIAGIGALSMIAEFFATRSESYIQLGLGLSVIMAALAGKYFVEGKADANAKETAQ